MQKLAISKLEQSSYALQGDLVFSTINKSVLNTLDFKQKQANINIDLQQVNEIDSAGLALLIEWIKLAKIKQITLHFDNLPTQLTALAKLSYISDIDLFTTKNN